MFRTTAARPLAALTVALSIVLLAAATGAYAADPPPELGWKTKLDLSYVLTSGNAESSSLGFNGESVRTWESSKLAFRALAIKAKNTDTVGTVDGINLIEEETVSAERYMFAVDFERKLSPKLFWMTTGSWERNEPTGISNRYLLAAGLGNQWYDTETFKWKTNYLATGTSEEPVVGDTADYLGLRLGSDLLWKFSPTAEYKNLFFFDEDLDETDNWRAEMTNAVTVTMTKTLALKASLILYYDNVPALRSVDVLDPVTLEPTGTTALIELDEMDSVFTTSLVISF